ncbi:MAG: hypothetical protein F6K61_01355 [Sphaerospermopsis sp. SIO1G1]|nr:hypothetical protein [Sphaerospermopsis sp. SIO1G1]
MIMNTSIEERFSALEITLAQLQKQILPPQQINWLEQITGSFKNEPAFEDIIAYGKSIREDDESILEIQDT